MAQNVDQNQLKIGFLTSLGIPERGYVAGLLVTNRFGRPLEFQCTTPVKPNKTQQILYGPTLVPFILSELIGRTLVEKVGVKPHLVVTDRPEILELRNHISIPVICLADVPHSASATPNATDSAPHDADNSIETDQRSVILESTPENTASDSILDPSEDRSLVEIKIGNASYRVHARFLPDQKLVARLTAEIPAETDWCEPLGRVREALRETVGDATSAA